jgi:ferredoxin
MQMNVIDPIRCTDCQKCVSVCPTRAIFHEDLVPDEWVHYTLLNYFVSTETSATRLSVSAVACDSGSAEHQRLDLEK